MSERAEQWLRYADENLEAARVLFSSGHFNPCLQNIQQAAEKFLKALLVARGLPLRRTHSILGLLNLLLDEGLEVSLSEDDCHLLVLGCGSPHNNSSCLSVSGGAALPL